MRQNWPAPILAAIFLLIVTFACGGSRDLRRVIAEYQDAGNANDVAKSLALLTDDITLDVPQMLHLSGKTELQYLLEYDAALKTHLAINIQSAGGDSVICDATERNDLLSAAGLDSVYFPQVVFVFKGDGIQSINATMDELSQAAVSGVQEGVLQWAKENEPEKLAELMPEDVYTYNAESARRSLELVKLWKANTAR